MTEQVYDSPLFNSPYAYLACQRELLDGLPTNHISQWQLTVDFITPTLKPQKRRKSNGPQMGMISGEGFTEYTGLQPNPTQFVPSVRDHVDKWKRLHDRQSWRINPTTAHRLPL